MQTILRAWNWLVVSSADPSKTATTVKGFLGIVISGLVVTSPLTHLHVGSDQLSAVADQIVQIVALAAGIISAVATVGGLIRKIVVTVQQFGQ